MTIRAQIRIKVLKALRCCDGVPMPEDSLSGAVLPFINGAGHTDVRAELVDLEANGYLVSEQDMFTGIKSFTLTTKGHLQAKTL
jgi:hypothetical protein